jgi:hypothetical protein
VGKSGTGSAEMDAREGGAEQGGQMVHGGRRIATDARSPGARERGVSNASVQQHCRPCAHDHRLVAGRRERTMGACPTGPDRRSTNHFVAVPTAGPPSAITRKPP